MKKEKFLNPPICRNSSEGEICRDILFKMFESFLKFKEVVKSGDADNFYLRLDIKVTFTNGKKRIISFGKMISISGCSLAVLRHNKLSIDKELAFQKGKKTNELFIDLAYMDYNKEITCGYSYLPKPKKDGTYGENWRQITRNVKIKDWEFVR